MTPHLQVLKYSKIYLLLHSSVHLMKIADTMSAVMANVTLLCRLTLLTLMKHILWIGMSILFLGLRFIALLTLTAHKTIYVQANMLYCLLPPRAVSR